MYELIVASLGVFGLATIIAQYDGPANVFGKLRSKRMLNGLLSCSVCVGVWLAIPIAALCGLSVSEYFATLGIAIVMERLT